MVILNSKYMNGSLFSAEPRYMNGWVVKCRAAHLYPNPLGFPPHTHTHTPSHGLHMINRRYVLFLGEYQIYFTECVENISTFTSAKNTKYISPNVLKTIVLSRVPSTSENADVFNTCFHIFNTSNIMPMVQRVKWA